MPRKNETYDQAGNAFGDDDPSGGPGSREFGRQSGILFEQAMAQTRMAVCLSDPRAKDMPIVFANRAFRELTGYSDDEIFGRNCRFLQGPETDRDAVRTIARAIEDERVAVVELLNYRKDGTPFWNALHIGPIYDAQGELLYFFGSQWDVTEVHSARAEQRHSDMMARELSHRIKNIFQVIAGLVGLIGRRFDAVGVANRIVGSIQALSRAHEPTFDKPATGGLVEMGPSIRAVVEPYGDGRVRVEGPSIRVPSPYLSTIALALNEFGVNAVRHGALCAEAGRVDVTWAVADETLTIAWAESGGPAVDGVAPGRGTSLIDRLVGGTGGRIERDWDRSGLVARIHLDLPERT